MRVIFVFGGPQLALSTALSDKSTKMDAVTNVISRTADGLFPGGDRLVLRVDAALLRPPGHVVVGASRGRRSSFFLEFDPDHNTKRLSALTYMFAGYAKGFLTVAISVLFYHEP